MDIVSPRRSSAASVILKGCLVVGLLNGLDAIVFFSARGATVSGIFQYIASGVLGGGAFTSGTPAFLLGVLLHFLIAALLTAGYLAAARRIPALWQQPWLFGAIYGIGVFLVMTRIITPLSRVPFVAPFSWPVFLHGIVGHVAFVGIPIALIVRHAFRKPGGVGASRGLHS